MKPYEQELQHNTDQPTNPPLSLKEPKSSLYRTMKGYQGSADSAGEGLVAETLCSTKQGLQGGERPGWGKK